MKFLLYRKFFVVLCLGVFVIFCTVAQTQINVTQHIVNFGKHTVSHPRKIDVIIIHSVFNPFGTEKYSLQQILDGFRHYHVSAHYIIDRGGVIYQLVKENNISYHAGKSRLPDGRSGVNSCSIGIELITSSDSTDSPTPGQVNSLVALVRDIKSRYTIKYVLRHADVAPGRKTDPWNLNWEQFLKQIDQ